MRLSRPWLSREERDEARQFTGRQGAFARGMRQAADRDGLMWGESSSWQPGPAPAPRQARKQERELSARRADPRSDLERARTVARAMEQSARRSSR